MKITKINYKFAISFIVLLLFMGAGCNSSSIKGVVENNAGEPIEGVYVMVGDRIAETRENGKWKLVGVEESGENIFIAGNGYVPAEEPFGKKTSVELVSNPSVPVSINVQNERWVRQPGAFVVLLDGTSGRPVNVVETDEKGVASFESVPSSRATFFVIMKGYDTGYVSMVVAKKKKNNAIVRLSKENSSVSYAPLIENISEEFRFLSHFVKAVNAAAVTPTLKKEGDIRIYDPDRTFNNWKLSDIGDVDKDSPTSVQSTKVYTIQPDLLHKRLRSCTGVLNCSSLFENFSWNITLPDREIYDKKGTAAVSEFSGILLPEKVDVVVVSDPLPPAKDEVKGDYKNFLTLDFAAGSEAVEINSLAVKRLGVSSDTNVNDIYVIGEPLAGLPKIGNSTDTDFLDPIDFSTDLEGLSDPEIVERLLSGDGEPAKDVEPIKNEGKSNTGVCGDGIVQNPNSTGVVESCDPPWSDGACGAGLVCEINCQCIFLEDDEEFGMVVCPAEDFFGNYYVDRVATQEEIDAGCPNLPVKKSGQ